MSETGGLQPLECSIRLPHHSRALAGQDDRAGSATAACGGDFGTWLEGLKEEATARGVSQSTIQSIGWISQNFSDRRERLAHFEARS